MLGGGNEELLNVVNSERGRNVKLVFKGERERGVLFAKSTFLS